MNLQSIKKVLKKIVFLPPGPTLLIAVPSYGFVIYVLTGENIKPAVAYAAYFLSAYAFIITITGITGIVHWICMGVENHPFVRKMLTNHLINKYTKEAVFRAEAALHFGFFINLLYAGIKLFSGVYYKSVWFITLAVYYIFLAIMRFFLLHHVRKRKKPGYDKAAEWRRYRICGIILLFMNWILAGMLILVIHQNQGFEYPEMLIYLIALYTFYAIITAVINVIKFRKYGSPVLSSAKVINLTAALVSMFSLETAMLAQFGSADNAGFRKIMTSCTGAGVSLIVVGMAVYMIIRSTKELKKERTRGRNHDTYISS